MIKIILAFILCLFCGCLAIKGKPDQPKRPKLEILEPYYIEPSPYFGPFIFLTGDCNGHRD